MRRKLATLPNEGYRLNLTEAEWRAFCIVDNTLVSTSRPGGGPIHGGEQSPRYDTFLQRAFYTGWKKLFGLKWQTVILPCGMHWEIWGPASARHNDSWTLAESGLENSLNTYFTDDELVAEYSPDERLDLFNNNIVPKFQALGDSAYVQGPTMRVGGGRGVSAIREPIEWMYKDLKTKWKIIDYKHALKLLQLPIGQMVFCCIILCDAYACMNQNQISGYFECNPPTFEEWTAQGRQARPIPQSVREQLGL